jgi:hypothetical protein
VLAGGVLQPGGTPAFNFSGAVVASTGVSVSSGTYTIPSNANIGGMLPVGSSGKFSGYSVPPFNGTFAGTITGLGVTDQISITATQDSNFGITASGTDTELGVLINLSISPSVGRSNVIGAVIEANGQESNVNIGTRAFQVFGHSNPTGTSVLLGATGVAGVETGTLTKQ